MVMTSIFSFSHNVLNCFLLQSYGNPGFFGKGLHLCNMIPTFKKQKETYLDKEKMLLTDIFPIDSIIPQCLLLLPAHQSPSRVVVRYPHHTPLQWAE